ncbi:hypothetical protein INT43_008686 [Umbelopsis isabellina]|uniref:peptidylprolyl isomerase n=1 Tax=Mortierella isabellina TaxID=91625 RepID=A0A8H7UJC3_MORIS|nr:hypothetical protein INT43_008686 [Umbelopsis isabellina]
MHFLVKVFTSCPARLTLKSLRKLSVFPWYASFGEEIKSQERTCVKVTVDDKEYVLCGLTPKHIEQQLLDHTFVEGEEVTFSISGENAVHLTGNYLPDDDMDQDPYDSDDLMMGSSDEDDLEVDSEEEDEDEDALINGIVTNGAKRLAAAEPDSDEEEESDEEEIVPAPKTKNEKKRAAEAAADASANKKQKAQEAAKKPEAKKAEAKKPEAKKAEAKKPETKKPEAKKEEPKKEQPKATKLANGLLIEDVKVGTGPKAKAGQRIGMRYIGKLKSGKVFDKNVSGKPFNFGLGRGEVIKGWDQGIVGMQIGGERRLTIPAPLAYGSQSLPGIPKNSTLIFDVKLLSMK